MTQPVEEKPSLNKRLGEKASSQTDVFITEKRDRFEEDEKAVLRQILFRLVEVCIADDGPMRTAWVQ